jgi:hypothetical protein
LACEYPEPAFDPDAEYRIKGAKSAELNPILRFPGP